MYPFAAGTVLRRPAQLVLGRRQWHAGGHAVTREAATPAALTTRVVEWRTAAAGAAWSVALGSDPSALACDLGGHIGADAFGGGTGLRNDLGHRLRRRCGGEAGANTGLDAVLDSLNLFVGGPVDRVEFHAGVVEQLRYLVDDP